MTDQITPYLAYWKKQQAQKKEIDRLMTEKAKSVLPQLIQVLVNEFQAKKIILFGSLAKGKFTQTSDIDLAVAGIPPERYFRALATVNSCTEFEIDLKPLEDLKPYFYHRVMETGKIIYESVISE